MSISLAAVHTIYEVTSTSKSSNDVHTLKSLCSSNLVLLPLLLPTSLAMISVSYATFIYVHYADSIMKCFNEPSCCELSLELGSRIVLH